MVDIRRERPRDLAAIRAVLTDAFPSPAEAQLVERLRKAERLVVSLVAEAAGEVVGHVAFSPVTVPGASDGLGLAPLAVAPQHQRRGVGSLLVRHGVEICRGAGFGFVIVLGDPMYYGRFGFLAASRWGLVDEYGGGDAFQAIELRPGAIPHDAGLVRFAAEFAGLT